MTILLETTIPVTILAGASQDLLVDVEIAEPDDGFMIDLSVDDSAAVASAQRIQRIGWRVDIDRGDGTMVTLPEGREVAASINITESTESFGDRLTFRLVGEKWSPFDRALIRTDAEVHVYANWGGPGAEHVERVFRGRIVSATFTGHPWGASIVALDETAAHAKKGAKSYALPPNHGKSRLEITTELLNEGVIPIRSLDLGPNGGGSVNKPVALGDRPILVYLRDMLAVIGVEIGFIDGGFVAWRYDASYPPVMELNPGNVTGTLSLEPRSNTLDPNVLGVVGTSVTRTEPGGIRTVTTKVTQWDTYAPLEWVTMHPVGAPPETPEIPNLAVPQPATFQIVSEVETKVGYFGSLDITTEQTTRGMYAVRATPSTIHASVDPPGYEYLDADFNWFTYPDGSTRIDPKEVLRMTRKMLRNKTLDANRNVIGVREASYFFHWYQRALWQVTAGEDVFIGEGAWVNDEGDAVSKRVEVMGLLSQEGGVLLEGETPAVFDGTGFLARYLNPDDLVETVITLNDDETIAERITTHRYHDIGAQRRRADGAYGYGADERTYTNRDEELPLFGAQPNGVTVTTERFRAITEDRYELVESVRVGDAPATVKVSQFIGSIPRPERANAETSGQEIRAEVADEFRIALVRGNEILKVEHNEFIETKEEADAYAAHLARKASAMVLGTEMCIEGLVHKWKPVTVKIPGIAVDAKFYVTGVVRDSTTFRQAVTAEHYPE